MTSETGGEEARERERIWRDAWGRAQPLLEGVARGRAPGAAPGVELAYLDWGGDGPLIVFFHANGFCAATWAPVASALRRRYRVVAFDARGHGDSTSVPPASGPDAYAWETLARDLDVALGALLARLGRPRIELGVGHSMGGAMVTWDAVLRPGRFERLLLCDPVLMPPARRAPGGDPLSGNPMAAASRKRRDRFPSAAEAYAHCRSRALYADFTPEALALYVGVGMREIEGGERVLCCDREVEAAIFDNGASLDLMPQIGSLSSELLILHAGKSGFSRPYYEELARKAPNGRVEGVDAGHLFPMDEPRLVVDAIERLLA